MAGTARPIVFLTDFGLTDEFVGICHGVIATVAPSARVLDLSHAIPPQDVRRGAIVLGRAIPYMPAEAVYLAVVDPGVGSARRGVAIAAGQALLVGPDNGLLSLAWAALGGVRLARGIGSEPHAVRPASRTFHGRDVFAPAAARLAAGVPLEDLGPELDPGTLQVLELPGPIVTPGAIEALVVQVDRFGNAQLNVRTADLAAAGLGEGFDLAGHRVPVVGTFADVAEGHVAAIEDSQGYVAIVLNRASAAERLGLGEGASVNLG